MRRATPRLGGRTPTGIGRYGRPDEEASWVGVGDGLDEPPTVGGLDDKFEGVAATVGWIGFDGGVTVAICCRGEIGGVASEVG